LQQVQAKQQPDFSIGPRRAITFDMFGDGIFNQDDAAWKSSRDMLRPHLHHKHYQSLDIFQAAIDDLISIIEASTGTLDLQPLFFRLTLDTTTAFLFGESVKSLVTPDSGESTFASAFDAGQKWVTKRFRLAGLYWLVNGKEWRQACKDVHEFADQLIDRNLALKKAGEEGFLHSIAEHSPNHTALRGQIINLLVAGRDTTACLLSWTL
jgi:cytochrome P450